MKRGYCGGRCNSAKRKGHQWSREQEKENFWKRFGDSLESAGPKQAPREREKAAKDTQDCNPQPERVKADTIQGKQGLGQDGFIPEFYKAFQS